MSVVTTNLTQGPGTVYTGAFGATEPTDALVNTTPAASAWSDLGGTDGGVKLSVDQKYNPLTVDQIVDRAGSRLVSRDIMISTSLAEFTLANLSTIMNGGTQASGSGYATFEPLYATSATQPNYMAFILDGWAPGGAFRRRVILRKGLSTSKVEASYMKDKQTFVPCEFTGHFVTTSIAPIHVADQTS